MRVALNASILRSPRTGIGHYVAELANALAAVDGLNLSLFNGWGSWEAVPQAPMPGAATLTSWIKRLIPGAYPLRRFVEQQRFRRVTAACTPDLYHDPSLWPLDFDGPMVMTLHDLTHVHFPHTQPADRLREIERHAARGVERAARILVDSQFIGSEVVRHFGIAPERVVVAPLGYAERFHPRAYADLLVPLQVLGLQPGRYLLCVGTLEPRKNLQLALRAYARLPEPLRRHYPLVLAGMPGWRGEELEASLRGMLADGQILVLGYQADETLAQLLAGARLLLFPSLYEGFGLPLLEAMASGTPAVISRSAALPEVAGDAGIQVDAQDDQGCSEALASLIEDQALWSRQHELGLSRAREFSWERCARITADVYREAVKS